MRRSSRGSDGHKKRTASGSQGVRAPEGSDRFLRPEGKHARQARLRATLRAAGRDPSRCGNCDLAGKTAVVHVVPESRGGTDRVGNLVSLCQDCKKRLPRKARSSDPSRSGGAPQLTLFG
ncbi:HNH endonuclease [bacterium]|nr:HNH endonuclease [bacterium]